MLSALRRFAGRTDDKAFDPAMLRHMAERSGATITYEAASHALFMTQAGVVADVIVTARRDAIRLARRAGAVSRTRRGPTARARSCGSRRAPS